MKFGFKMLDVRLYSYHWLLITTCVILLSLPSSTSATQTSENINKTGKFSQIINSPSARFDDHSASDFPKGPQNVQFEFIKTNQINVTWNIDQESLEYLKGFGLQLKCNYGLCKSNETENITLIPHHNEMTHFDMILDIPYGSTDIILYTHPHKDHCESSFRRNLAMMLMNSSNPQSKWSSPILIFNQQNENLDVKFSGDPNITELCLENKKNYSKCSKESPAIFKDITVGNYNITIIPNDCKNRSSCEVIKASYIAYQEHCDHREIAEYLYPLLGGLFIGILALLILFVGVKINGLRRHNLVKKSILLLNTSDNEIHEEAVEHFITSLENLNIIVLRPTLPFNQETIQWLLNTVDKVVLLDSLALGKRQEAWAVNQDYLPFLEETNSKALTKYLFSVIGTFNNPSKTNHFLRCKWSFVPKDLEFKNYPDSPSYVMPGDFQLFAEMIHGSWVDLRDCRFAKCMLKQKILDEATYITQSPDWFTEKYGVPMSAETEMETYDHPVFNASDLISYVSSHLQKLNRKTDKDLDVNRISLSEFEVMSV